MRFSKAVLGLSIVAVTSLSATSRSTPQKPRMNALLVYGNDFMFGVTEPDGWIGDTSDKATRRKVNIVFFPADKASRANNVNIRIRVNSKLDENTIEDLNADIGGYRKEFPRLMLADFTVEHPKYKTYPKLLYVPDSFYEYVVYLNPGPDARLMFSVAMSKKGSPASEVEFKAFREVLASISLLSAPGFKVIKD
ncbi:MAG TPA: hypothetical protein VMS75_03490 [Terriglobales bacterium]|nr:hypothetical protein [Terriglobales bacterium]